MSDERKPQMLRFRSPPGTETRTRAPSDERNLGMQWFRSSAIEAVGGPSGDGGRGVAAVITGSAERLVVRGVHIDLDGPFQSRNREIEPGGTIARDTEFVLANQSADPSCGEGRRHDDLRMGLGSTS